MILDTMPGRTLFDAEFADPTCRDLIELFARYDFGGAIRAGRR